MMRMIDLVVYDDGDAILRWSAGEEKSGEPIAWFDDWTDAFLEFKDEPDVDLNPFVIDDWFQTLFGYFVGNDNFHILNLIFFATEARRH